MVHNCNVKVEFLNPNTKPKTICADTVKVNKKDNTLDIVARDGTPVCFPLCNVMDFQKLPPSNW